MSIFLLRGRLEMKLHDMIGTQKDFEASYASLPSAGPAEKLGEIAELKKDLTRAIVALSAVGRAAMRCRNP